jgi:hypothetical protein
MARVTPPAFPKIYMMNFLSIMDCISNVPIFMGIKEADVFGPNSSGGFSELKSGKEKSLERPMPADVSLRGVGLAVCARALFYCREEGVDYDLMAAKPATIDWHLLVCERHDPPGRPSPANFKRMRNRCGGLLVIGEDVTSAPVRVVGSSPRMWKTPPAVLTWEPAHHRANEGARERRIGCR